MGPEAELSRWARMSYNDGPLLSSHYTLPVSSSLLNNRHRPTHVAASGFAKII